MVIRHIFTDKYIVTVLLLAALALFINSAFVPSYRIVYNKAEKYEVIKQIDIYKDSANCKVWHCEMVTEDGKTKIIHVIIPYK